MTSEAEAAGKAERHAIYKAGVATADQIRTGAISEQALKEKGFIRDPATGDWSRPLKGSK